MAGKPLNRLELRRQSEAAEPLDPMEDETEDVVELDDDDDEVSTRRPKKKAKAPTKSKAKSARAPKPAARMKVVWVVMNDAYKAVGTFEYNQKEAAEARAAELTAKGKGTHFVQRSKEEMPADAPGIGASIPRTEVAPSRAKSAAKPAKAVVAAVEEDEEIEDDDEPEVEVDDDDDSGDDDE
ncbi:hypothetical protein [Paludisphaera rhizosphaerae]|uniref:hypothetical protein n=1 Tax=Paludisphaera rhizosphaerae TaxID=2711216 RepID=UPI0013ED90C3|nr:hypothetical protein [Paludisphaera rhizosphaerae]